MELIKIFIWIAYVLGFYFLVYWLLMYLDNRDKIRKTRTLKLKSHPLVSVVVPAYNEEKGIQKTLMSLIRLNYPKNRIEIIVVNDGSKDGTRQKIKEFIKKHPHVRLLDQKNQGKAQSLNNALKIVKGEYFACLDADSYVTSEALERIMAEFQQDKRLSIVTPIMRVTKPKSMMQKFQRIEYLAAMLTVKMMSFMDCHYVTPGPFSIYRTEVVRKLGGFDTESIVEDQEICCHAQKMQYKIGQCTSAIVYTHAPYTLKGLQKQRNRWFKGTLLNVYKYRGMIFNKKYGDFGFFQLPLVIISYFLGIVAIASFLYYILKPVINQLRHLFLINFDIMPYFQKFHYDPNFLAINITTVFVIYLLLGITILMLYFASRMTKERVRQYGTLFILPYFFVYFLILSFILVRVLIELAIGKKQKW